MSLSTRPESPRLHAGSIATPTYVSSGLRILRIGCRIDRPDWHSGRSGPVLHSRPESEDKYNYNTRGVDQMRKKYLGLVATAAMAFSMVAVTTAPVSAEPKRGGTLNMIYRVIGAHFNPTIVSGTPTGIAATQLFSSLTRVDKDWKVHPLLAESWTTSDDGMTITLNLVKNAVFHDGHPLTSEDVKFSLETYKAQHPFKPMYAPVETIDTPDDHTVVLNLSRPHPAIMIAMSGQLGAVIPKHIYSEGNIRKNPRNSNDIVGSGPFKLKEFKPGEYIIL